MWSVSLMYTSHSIAMFKFWTLRVLRRCDDISYLTTKCYHLLRSLAFYLSLSLSVSVSVSFSETSRDSASDAVSQPPSTGSMANSTRLETTACPSCSCRRFERTELLSVVRRPFKRPCILGHLYGIVLISTRVSETILETAHMITNRLWQKTPVSHED